MPAATGLMFLDAQSHAIEYCVDLKIEVNFDFESPIDFQQ